MTIAHSGCPMVKGGWPQGGHSVNWSMVKGVWPQVTVNRSESMVKGEWPQVTVNRSMVRVNQSTQWFTLAVREVSFSLTSLHLPAVSAAPASPSHCHPQPQTPETPNLNPSEPQMCTSQTTNHKPQTTNHKPQTTNHKPQTPNPKPKARQQ